MAVILTLASSKGGSGKTTVGQVLAGAMAGACRVCVLDADPTRALSRWAGGAYEGAPLQVHAEADETALAHLIDRAAAEADLVLIDTAGFGNRAASVAMMGADAVLVPCLSGEADVTEAEKTVRMVEGLAKAARREIPVRVLLNRHKPRTDLARHAAGEIERAGLPRLQAHLSDLVAYGEVSFSGKAPAGGTAAAEIVALVQELRGLGWLPRSEASRR